MAVRRSYERARIHARVPEAHPVPAASQDPDRGARQGNGAAVAADREAAHQQPGHRARRRDHVAARRGAVHRGAHAAPGLDRRDHHRPQHLLHRRGERRAPDRRRARPEGRAYHELRRGGSEKRGWLAGRESHRHRPGAIEGKTGGKPMTTSNPYAAPKAAVADETVVPDTDFVPGGQSRPIGHGWHWITEAWALFKRQPGMWIGTVLLLFLIMMGTALIPFIGGLFMTLFGPVFAAGIVRSEEHTSELQSPSQLVCRPRL